MHNWKEILDNHGRNVWITIRRLIDDEYEAEDCFQDVFTIVYEISCRKRIKNIGGLLQHIAVRKSIDRLRKITAVRQNRVSLDTSLDIADESESAAALEKEELADRLQKALSKVPAKEAEVFCLFHFSQLKYSDIAEVTGIKKNAVGVYLRRCREKLSRYLRDFQNQKG